MIYRHYDTYSCPSCYGGSEHGCTSCEPEHKPSCEPEFKPSCEPEFKLWFECGHFLQDAIFEIDDGTVEENQTFVLGRVLVNTAGLSRPVVKIDFSTIIFFEAEDEGGGPEHEVEVDLFFSLVRVCDGYSETLQTWRYLKEFDIENSIDELEVELSESFSVSFCDRTCPACCEYQMIVEGNDFEGDFDALRVVTPDLSAFVQGTKA